MINQDQDVWTKLPLRKWLPTKVHDLESLSNENAWVMNTITISKRGVGPCFTWTLPYRMHMKVGRRVLHFGIGPSKWRIEENTTAFG